MPLLAKFLKTLFLRIRLLRHTAIDVESMKAIDLPCKRKQISEQGNEQRLFDLHKSFITNESWKVSFEMFANVPIKVFKTSEI